MFALPLLVIIVAGDPPERLEENRRGPVPAWWRTFWRRVKRLQNRLKPFRKPAASKLNAY